MCEGVKSCPRAGCGRSACPVRRAGCGNGATVRVLGHRQTKGAATDKPNLLPPRHISTLPIAPSNDRSRVRAVCRRYWAVQRSSTDVRFFRARQPVSASGDEPHRTRAAVCSMGSKKARITNPARPAHHVAAAIAPSGGPPRQAARPSRAGLRHRSSSSRAAVMSLICLAVLRAAARLDTLRACARRRGHWLVRAASPIPRRFQAIRAGNRPKLEKSSVPSA